LEKYQSKDPKKARIKTD